MPEELKTKTIKCADAETMIAHAYSAGFRKGYNIVLCPHHEEYHAKEDLENFLNIIRKDIEKVSY